MCKKKKLLSTAPSSYNQFHIWKLSTTSVRPRKRLPSTASLLHNQLSESYKGSNMKGCTKCILLLLLFSLFLYLFYNTGTLKLAMRKTINKIISGNRSYSNERELKKRRRTSEEGEQLSNNVTKVKNIVTTSKLRSEKVKVLLLAYGRTGSSLTGELISANTASAYFFEPFWQVW